MKKRTNSGEPIKIIPVEHYKRDDWQQVRALSEDPETLYHRYEDWQYFTHRYLVKNVRRNIKLQPVYIKTAALQDWCYQRGIPITARTREQYITASLPQLLAQQSGWRFYLKV